MCVRGWPQYWAHRSSIQKRLIPFPLIPYAHKSQESNDIFQLSIIAVDIQVSCTCPKQQSYHWTLIGPGINNASFFLRAVKEAIGKTCRWKPWNFSQRLYTHLKEMLIRSILVKITQANIAHNPQILEGLFLFHNNRCSCSAMRLCST